MPDKDDVNPPLINRLDGQGAIATGSDSKKQDGSVLIVGGDGTIGRNLVKSFGTIGRTVWHTTRRRDVIAGNCLFLDLSGDVTGWSLGNNQIDVAIFCAAITSMEQCRREQEVSRRVNVAGTITLAKGLIETGTFVVFLSTNAVFDGETPFAKVTDPVHPITEYGRQKAEAESQLQALSKRVAIVRLTKILNPNMPLLQNWIRNLMIGSAVHPLLNMVMAPVSVRFAVTVLLEIVNRKIAGIFHVSAADDVSYVTAARYIARRLGAADDLVQPISYREVGLENVPKNTTLDTRQLSALGYKAPHALEAINGAIDLALA